MSKDLIAIIPARGGSKRLKNKNIYPLHGLPLIAYTIKALEASAYVEEIYVSSDSQEILDVSSEYGALPLLRSKQNSDDKTPKIVAIREALEQLDTKPKNVIVPQANSPQIQSEHIDKAYEMFLEHNLWEVMSADKNGVQNAAFRILRYQTVFQNFLSAHCGFYVAPSIDVHTLEDIQTLEKQSF